MTVRAVVLGYGFIGTMHVEAARSLGDAVEVVGVAGHRAEPAAALARRFGIERSTTDWRTLAAEPSVDLVVIGTPNSFHFEQTMHALEQGKHVLVEKPMATTVGEAEVMVSSAGERGLVLAVGHMWRYHADVVDFRRRIAAGEFGRIVRTHGWGVHAGWGPSGWFTDPALSGGGALIDMGIHALDTVRFLLGDPQPRRVLGSVGIGEFGDYDVDDDGLVIVEWEGGVRSLVEFGWWEPRLNGLEADTEVFGTAGSGRIWPGALPPPDDYVHCTVPMYAAQLADVARACRNGGDPACSSEVGLTALRIVEQAYRSAAEGRPAS